jgi:very-long-chain (3R)-3-hydroxyacyl-CoA dehydratase
MGLGRVYLLVYNLAMVLGWGTILAGLLLNGLSEPKFVWQPYTHPLIRLLTLVFQTAMLLDVLHAALGLSRTSPITALLQVISRVWVVWGVLELYPHSENSLTLLFAWSWAEVIRYAHYIRSDIGTVEKTSWLLFLRYSLFIPLYPMGVASELLCLKDAWSIISLCCPRVFSLAMPNSLNFAFDYRWFILYMVLPAYVLGFPYLYRYMLSQRKAKLQPKLD